MGESDGDDAHRTILDDRVGGAADHSSAPRLPRSVAGCGRAHLRGPDNRGPPGGFQVQRGLSWRRHLADRIERMLVSSAMPFVAEAAGLDMAEMNWAEPGYDLRPDPVRRHGGAIVIARPFRLAGDAGLRAG